ncbi:hypothetical protein B296_00041284 [Ensete ventricosum]|uniref:Uncharacterized protein n=1 Tax=Ensete ventricosum TaxID=4639 RepID=A0A426XKS5_ENSVE|nr:hypothetical protein B296_00041284 [Ensete ventricosum]
MRRSSKQSVTSPSHIRCTLPNSISSSSSPSSVTASFRRLFPRDIPCVWSATVAHSMSKSSTAATSLRTASSASCVPVAGAFCTSAAGIAPKEPMTFSSPYGSNEKGSGFPAILYIMLPFSSSATQLYCLSPFVHRAKATTIGGTERRDYYYISLVD